MRKKSCKGFFRVELGKQRNKDQKARYVFRGDKEDWKASGRAQFWPNY